MAHLQPTHDEAERAIGQLVNALQSNLRSLTSIRVNEVVKAGSLGHGTAVPGHFDIDLVLYSSDVSEDTVNDYGYGVYLRKLQAFFSNQQIFSRGEISEMSTTRFAVQFIYQGYISVDFLVSPVWWDSQANKTPTKLFNFLKTQVAADAEARHKFTVNASKWQVLFLKNKASEAKEYIRRAKAWRNKLWPKREGGRGRPSSYLLSLLVLRAFEHRDHGHNTALRTTEKFKEIIRNHRRMNIHWEGVYYRAADYPTLFPSALPRLVDPANPANNVYESGIGPYPRNKKPCDYERGNGDWSEFQRKVEYFDLTQSVESI